MLEQKKISDAAVKKATGKNWKQWFAILNKNGAKRMAHRDIARFLHDGKYISSSWWVQMVTVQYEYAYQKRTLGKTADVGFEIGVTKTVPFAPAKIWKFVMSPAGRKVWLGQASGWKATPGTEYETNTGTRGEVRTVHAGKRIRLTWQPKGWKAPSTLQLTLIPRQSTRGTCISFHQEKLASEKDRTRMRTHWQEVLAKLEEDL